jgi:hypothetical protein
MKRWHIRLTQTDPVLAALTAYAVKSVLQQNGFSVEPLPLSQVGFTVSHSSAYALDLLLLKNQLPQSIAIEEIPV